MQETLTQLSALVHSLDLTAFANQNAWLFMIKSNIIHFNFDKYQFNIKSLTTLKLIIFFSCFLYEFILLIISSRISNGFFPYLFSASNSFFGYLTFLIIYLIQIILQFIQAMCKELLLLLSVWYNFSFVFWSRNLIL